MASTKYTYSIADDTANGAVAASKLITEIGASSIVTAFDYINITGDVLDIWMKDALSGGDQTTLGTVVGAHDGVPASVAEEVKIQEESTKTGKNGTGGGFGCKGFAGTPSTSADWQDLVTFSFPFAVSLLDAITHVRSACDKDLVEFVVAEDTIVGALTADEASGQTVLSVDATTIANVDIGTFITLDDGTNADACGRVTAVDAGAGTITVETATTNSFAAATPTYVKATRKMAETVELVGGQNLQVGFGSVGGSYVPANTEIILKYKNVDQVASKRFGFIAEFLR